MLNEHHLDPAFLQQLKEYIREGQTGAVIQVLLDLDPVLRHHDAAAYCGFITEKQHEFSLSETLEELTQLRANRVLDREAIANIQHELGRLANRMMK